MRVLAKSSTGLGWMVAATCWSTLASSAVAAQQADHFSQSFEANTDGWYDYYGGAVSRVPDGTAGVQSFDGVYHATVPISADDGPVTRWGGFHDTFPPLGYWTRVAVSIATELADGADKRFDFSSAINSPDGQHRRDFIFHLGTKPGVPGVWCASVSNNAPGEPCSASRQPVEITQSGWYQLVSLFRAKPASDVLEVEMRVIDATGMSVGSWTLSEPTDIIGETVGGNRYGWFVYNDFAGLPIDAAQRSTVLPEPPPTQAEVIVGGAGVVARDHVTYGFRLFAHHTRKGATEHLQLRLVRSREQHGDCDPWRKGLHANHDYFEAEAISSLSVEQSSGLDVVSLAGTGRWNNADGYSFEAVVSDGDGGGRGVDTLSIVVRDPLGSVVASVHDAPVSLGEISAYVRPLK